ncbi:hypothetical protein NDU88_001537 [Pleurodeles waltl]|uniref:Uncharacterized protein n=1 Tax=Pleurodeles waltl TaxID=8319 RepID=A0AAV7S980_PLEWA|nr:hypothetical protein NDU88_001537 [Pleurodeles waltl]
MEPAEWEGATGAVAPVANFKVGPAYGGPCSAHAIGTAGTPGALRHPILPSCSWRANRQEQEGGMGCLNPHGGAASCAAMEDSEGQRKTGGRPPVFLF